MNTVNMPTVTLNDGNKMPAIGLGIFGVDDSKAATIVEEAIKVGYRLLDTASLYENERGVGQGIRNSGINREELFVITKLHEDVDSYDGAVKGFNESLEKLGLDYLDLYLIHWPQPKVNKYIEIWQAFESILSTGKVKSIGVSNFTQAQLERLISETEVIPAVNQVELHPTLQQKLLKDTVSQMGIITQAWSPLGGQGQFKKLLQMFDVPDIENPVLQGLGAKHNLTPSAMRGYLESLPSDTIFGNLVLTEIAKKHDKSVAQIVLRWQIEIGVVPLPKTENIGRLRENISIFDFALDERDHEMITSLETGRRTGFDPELFN
jgi:2,5-diketo-D-gluconate reductase A